MHVADSESILYGFPEDYFGYEGGHVAGSDAFMVGAFGGVTVRLGIPNQVRSEKTIADAYNRLFGIMETAKKPGELKAH